MNKTPTHTALNKKIINKEVLYFSFIYFFSNPNSEIVFNTQRRLQVNKKANTESPIICLITDTKQGIIGNP